MPHRSRFLAAGFSSFPIIRTVYDRIGVVRINHAQICNISRRGVYSAAQSQGQLLAVAGALLLVAAHLTSRLNTSSPATKIQPALGAVWWSFSPFRFRPSCQTT
ncbi:MAG TPA: hypothetical protein VGI60_07530 [Chthoniobacterales bacterium]|jgi:hypothetical protein